MILLYLVILLLVGLTKWLIWMRVVALEKKYVAVSTEAKKLTGKPQYKAGNSKKPQDTYQHAKNQYELGLLVHKRDQVEAKYNRWQAKYDKVNKRWNGLRRWKGKFLPYLFGIADVALTLFVLHWLGHSEHLSTDQVQEWVRTW